MAGIGIIEPEVINLDFWNSWSRRFYNVRTYDNTRKEFEDKINIDLPVSNTDLPPLFDFLNSNSENDNDEEDMVPESVSPPHATAATTRKVDLINCIIKQFTINLCFLF